MWILRGGESKCWGKRITSRFSHFSSVSVLILRQLLLNLTDKFLNLTTCCIQLVNSLKLMSVFAFDSINPLIIWLNKITQQMISNRTIRHKLALIRFHVVFDRKYTSLASIYTNLFDVMSAKCSRRSPALPAVLNWESSLIHDTLFINSLCHFSLFTLCNHSSASWEEVAVYKDAVKWENLKSVDGAFFCFQSITEMQKMLTSSFLHTSDLWLHVLLFVKGQL